MKIITRYLIREILHTFRLFMSIFLVILFVQIVYENLGDILQKSPPLLSVIQFLVYSLPEKLTQTFPMVCLMSAIFSYGLLAKNKEILAMVASGVSFYRLCVPAIFFGIIMTGFMFWFNESVVPASIAQSNYIKKNVIKERGRKESVLTKNKDQLVKGKDNRFYYVENYDAARKELSFPAILDLNTSGSGVAQRIEADRALLKPDAAGVYWGELVNGERWTFNADGGTIAHYEKLPPGFRLELEKSLDVFLSKDKKPEEMNFTELHQYVGLMKQRNENVDIPRLTLQRKLSAPLGCLLLALIGFAVVADVHARHFARGVTLGLLIAVGFYVLDAFCNGMVKRGRMDPLLAGWVPITLVAIITLILLNRLKRIRG